MTTTEEGDPEAELFSPSQEDIGSEAGRETGAEHLTGCPRGSWECEPPGCVRRRRRLSRGREVRLLATGAIEEAEDRSGCSGSRERQRERIQMGRPGRRPRGRAGPGNLGGKEAGPGHSEPQHRASGVVRGRDPEDDCWSPEGAGVLCVSKCKEAQWLGAEPWAARALPVRMWGACWGLSRPPPFFFFWWGNECGLLGCGKHG